MEKTFIVKVTDSGDAEEYVIDLAKKALKKHHSAFAAIYGYADKDGKVIYFAEPLIKYSENDVKAFANSLRNGKHATDKVVYAIYRHQLDD